MFGFIKGIIAYKNNNVVVLDNNGEAIINEVTLGDERTENLPPLAIYYVEEAADLWQLSKRLLISPEILENQNKNLSFPINEKTQIVVFRQKEM